MSGRGCGAGSVCFFLQPGRLDVGFGYLPERTKLMTREEELASQAVSPAPNFSFRSWVGGRKEEAGPGKVGLDIPSRPRSRGSGRLTRRGLGECVFKSEPPAPSSAGAGAPAGRALAGAVIGGPSRPAPRRWGRGAPGPQRRAGFGWRTSHRRRTRASRSGVFTS